MNPEPTTGPPLACPKCAFQFQCVTVADWNTIQKSGRFLPAICSRCAAIVLFDAEALAVVDLEDWPDIKAQLATRPGVMDILHDLQQRVLRLQDKSGVHLQNFPVPHNQKPS